MRGSPSPATASQQQVKADPRVFRPYDLGGLVHGLGDGWRLASLNGHKEDVRKKEKRVGDHGGKRKKAWGYKVASH